LSIIISQLFHILLSYLECGVSVISLDQATPPLMEAFVWTWDLQANEPNPQHHCTAMSLQTGRWRTLPCNLPLPVLCRNQHNDLYSTLMTKQHETKKHLDGETLLVSRVFRSDQTVFKVQWDQRYMHPTYSRRRPIDVCPRGFGFSVPRTSWENTIARDSGRQAQEGGGGSDEFIWIDYLTERTANTG
jgi:hypothetical protein